MKIKARKIKKSAAVAAGAERYFFSIRAAVSFSDIAEKKTALTTLREFFKM